MIRRYFSLFTRFVLSQNWYNNVLPNNIYLSAEGLCLTFYLILYYIHCNLFQKQIKTNIYDGLYKSADFIAFHYFAITAKNSKVDC